MLSPLIKVKKSKEYIYKDGVSKYGTPSGTGWGIVNNLLSCTISKAVATRTVKFPDKIKIKSNQRLFIRFSSVTCDGYLNQFYYNLDSTKSEYSSLMANPNNVLNDVIVSLKNSNTDGEYTLSLNLYNANASWSMACKIKEIWIEDID